MNRISAGWLIERENYIEYVCGFGLNEFSKINTYL